MITTDREHTIRYVPTYINRDGMRTLMLAQQGRCTFETAREAEQWIDAVRAQAAREGGDTLQIVFGADTFEVCACPCYPGHFDPQTCWFDDADIVREARS